MVQNRFAVNSDSSMQKKREKAKQGMAERHNLNKSTKKKSEQLNRTAKTYLFLSCLQFCENSEIELGKDSDSNIICRILEKFKSNGFKFLYYKVNL